MDAQKHLKELREKYLKKMNNPRKVNEKYVRKAIEEYKKSIVSQQVKDYPTIKIMGAVFYDIDMSIAEFMKLKNATDMNDFVWTNLNL